MRHLSEENAETTFSSKRIFINDVDSYHSRHIIESILNDPKIPLILTCDACTSSQISKTVNVVEEEAYQICGTVSKSKKNELKDVTIIEENKVLEFLPYCGIVVLDITHDKKWLAVVDSYLKVINEILNTPNICLCRERFLILISPFLTWGLTKPLDPAFPILPFIETDYRKRKPHPNYKDHFRMENEVIAMGMKHSEYFRTVVLMAGMTYGSEEEILSFWFNKAWQARFVLPVIGTGNNIIPMIHVKDLGIIISNLILKPPYQPYIFAIEPCITTQLQIVKSLAEVCGSQKFQKIPKEDAFLFDGIFQVVFDNMTANKLMEPLYVMSIVGFSDYYMQCCFREKVIDLMSEFKILRHVEPPRVIVYGLPGSGKTTISRRIAKDYGVVYINPHTIQQEIIDDMAASLKNYEEISKADNIEDDDIYLDCLSVEKTCWAALAERTRDDLATLTSGKPLSDDDIEDFVRNRLMSNACINKGWVLDGYPENSNECESIFGVGYDIQLSKSLLGGGDAKIKNQLSNAYVDICNLNPFMPSVIINLVGSEEFISRKLTSVSECLLRDTDLEDLNYHKKMRRYKLYNNAESNPMDYFRKMQVTLKSFDIEEDTYEMDLIFKRITVILGNPCECQMHADKIEIKLMNEQTTAEKEIQEVIDSEEALQKKSQQEQANKSAYWLNVLQILREEEEEKLALETEPLQKYLLKFIVSNLVDALFACASNKPENPIDFLAQYLFENNIHGKMLPPGFDLHREIAAGAFEHVGMDSKELRLNISIPASEAVLSSSSTSSILSLPNKSAMYMRRSRIASVSDPDEIFYSD